MTRTRNESLQGVANALSLWPGVKGGDQPMSLRDKMHELKALHAKYKILNEERSSTADSRRYKEIQNDALPRVQNEIHQRSIEFERAFKAEYEMSVDEMVAASSSLGYTISRDFPPESFARHSNGPDGESQPEPEPGA